MPGGGKKKKGTGVAGQPKKSAYADNVLDHKLDLSMSSLDTVSVKDIQLIPLLTEIDLSNNLLTSLPDGVCDLANLVVLDVSQNKLESLPEDFGNLSSLKRLDLFGNRLKTLPLSFADLENLQWLDLKDNPLDESFIPLEVAVPALSDNDDRDKKRAARQVVEYIEEKRHKAEKEAEKRRKRKEREEASRLRREKEEKERLKQERKLERERKLREERAARQPTEEQARTQGEDDSGSRQSHEEELSPSSGSAHGLTGPQQALVLLVIPVALAIIAWLCHSSGLVDLSDFGTTILDLIGFTSGAASIW